MFKFIKGVLSDDAGRPSSQRVCMLLLTLFVLAALAVAQFGSLAWAIPAVTASFSDLIQWLYLALVFGVFAPKGVAAWQATKGVPDAGPAKE